MNFFKALCLSNRVEPENKRGIDYYQGYGCEVDYEKALALFQQESDAGDAESQYMLGLMFQTGVGCLKNDKKAYEMYEKSADQGHAKAQFKLGIYFLGDPYAVDKTKAFEMMERSAAQGNADAQNMLGIMLRTGVGCLPDPHAANAMFQKSASLGHIGSRNMLALHSSEDYEVNMPSPSFSMMPSSPYKLSNDKEERSSSKVTFAKGPPAVYTSSDSPVIQPDSPVIPQDSPVIPPDSPNIAPPTSSSLLYRNSLPKDFTSVSFVTSSLPKGSPPKGDSLAKSTSLPDLLPNSPRPPKRSPAEAHNSTSAEIYTKEERLKNFYGNHKMGVSMGRLVPKNNPATIEQIVPALAQFDLHQFEQILSASVHLLVKKSKVLEAQGQLDLASAYKKVALSVGGQLSSEARFELQSTISSANLLSKVAVNNAVKLRVHEMQEKMELKEELERQRAELDRRSAELDERERRMGVYGGDKEMAERLKQAEEKCERLDKEWRKQVDNLRAQLEEVHYYNFLDEVNRLIPKTTQIKCLIWFGCKDDHAGTKLRGKLNRIKADLNKAGMEVAIEGHKEFTDGESKVAIFTQHLANKRDGLNYSLERNAKVPNFITLILDGEPTKSVNAVVLNMIDHHQYIEKMITRLVPTLLEIESNETYRHMLEGFHAKIKHLSVSPDMQKKT